jgi:hypothetical protein
MHAYCYTQQDTNTLMTIFYRMKLNWPELFNRSPRSRFFCVLLLSLFSLHVYAQQFDHVAPQGSACNSILLTAYNYEDADYEDLWHLLPQAWPVADISLNFDDLEGYHHDHTLWDGMLVSTLNRLWNEIVNDPLLRKKNEADRQAISKV